MEICRLEQYQSKSYPTQLLVKWKGDVAYYQVFKSVFGYGGTLNPGYSFSQYFPDQFNSPGWWCTYIHDISTTDAKRVIALLKLLKQTILIRDGLQQTFALADQWVPNTRTEIAEMVFRAKNRNAIKLIPEIAERFTAFIEVHPLYDAADYVVAVPPSPNKNRYDLPTGITAEISKILGKPDGASFVEKLRDTSMKDMTPAKKVDHIRGAFAVKPNHPFNDKRVIVIDDLYHSGATLNEFGDTLRSVGARVIGLTAVKNYRNA